MPATVQQSDAIKLIGDWSKWVATVETASIAVIGAFARGSQNQDVSTITALSYGISVLFFMLSILLAAMVLLSLPAAVQDIAENDKVWDRVATIGPFAPKLRVIVGGQFLLFAAGILAFGFGAISSLVGNIHA